VLRVKKMMGGDDALGEEGDCSMGERVMGRIVCGILLLLILSGWPLGIWNSAPFHPFPM
jgi:hypothetical protein